MRNKIFFIFLFSLLCVCSAQAVFFKDLGYLPGGGGDEVRNSCSYDVSADGSIVVGSSRTLYGWEAFRWTESDGMVGLGDLPGMGFHSRARGISADGSTIVGMSIGEFDSEAFRWTESEGMVGLGDLSGGVFYSNAHDVSGDGSTVVGESEGEFGYEAFRWTENDGMVGLGDLPGGSLISTAWGVSDDGSTVVGRSEGVFGPEAFRWTESDGMVGLGDLPGSRFDSTATATSADGSIVVGTSRGGTEAFRWTESDGMVGLGALPGMDFSYAWGVSADGSTIVGKSYAPGEYEIEAIIWDKDNGMQSIKDILVSRGVDMTGWILHEAFSVSADGKTIVGWGTNKLDDPWEEPEAWIASLHMTIDEIIIFLEESVSGGSLVGTGRGNSANGRLNALRNMLEMAGDLIEINDIDGACVQLKAAMEKCDGDPLQPDFVTGPAAIQLSQMIFELMESLGCE